MDKEILQKVKDIEQSIKNQKEAIGILEDIKGKSRIIVYSFSDINNYGFGYLHFEDFEIQEMIHQKKQRIAALEKELEEL